MTTTMRNQISSLSADRTARSTLAGSRDRSRAALVQCRSARRQPGPRRADGHRAQAAHVRRAAAHRLQRDRGRLSGGFAAGLRLRARADRRGSHPRRRHHPGAHPGPRRSDRAHRGVASRRAASRGPPLQLDLEPAAARRVRPRPGGDPRHRGARRPQDSSRTSRQRSGDRDRARVLARELHGDRTRLRGGDL